MSQPISTMTRTTVRQYSPVTVLALWAAAAVPMGLLAWVVAPAVAGAGATQQRFLVTLIGALTAGLVWQFVLVLAMVAREQRSLRWSALRDALWLRPPSDRVGRRGGRLWWWAAAVTVGVAVLELVPLDPTGPSDRSFDGFLGSAEGQAFFQGNWGLFALVTAMFLFNTVLGEELLFRGLLLPRMRGAFGKADWVVNGILFGLYHLHQPWSIPSGITTGMLQAYATRRWRSAWLGIIAHSAQSVLYTVIIFMVVVS
jgi:membrane protease YdiL (CAAX protease family)